MLFLFFKKVQTERLRRITGEHLPLFIDLRARHEADCVREIMEMKRKVITTTMNIFWGITIMRMMTGVSTTVFLDNQNHFKVKCVKPREMNET